FAAVPAHPHSLRRKNAADSSAGGSLPGDFAAQRAADAAKCRGIAAISRPSVAIWIPIAADGGDGAARRLDFAARSLDRAAICPSLATCCPTSAAKRIYLAAKLSPCVSMWRQL